MEGNDYRPSKSRKTESTQLAAKPDIRGAFELHDLLRFKQAIGPETKAGVDQFKNFLSSIQRNEDVTDKEIQLKVLKQYCDDQSSSNKHELDFPDLLSTWSFAEQSNTEAVLSAVPATLAQFFRTISNELDFREFGLSLCDSLLKGDQIRLIDKGLSASKSKEYLISPCLRLLTEITSFDGGVLAGHIFARRDILLRRLDALLNSYSTNQDDTDRRQPTVRRNAQRLLLALLKYLDPASKIELISQGKALHSCLRKSSLDGGDIVRDLLECFRRDIIATDLPKQTKTRFLNSGNLALLGGLYTFEVEEIEEQADDQNTVSVRVAAHDFLVDVCTTKTATLLPQCGWYPLGFDPTTSHNTEHDEIDIGLDSPYSSDEYKNVVPVKNTGLSTFLQSLRPEKDTLQAELIVKIFDAAPELVAEYFVKKPKTAVTPKNEAAWRGYFAFIFSVVNLATPRNCGWHDGLPAVPPPASIVLESILPRPMERAVVIQCLNSADEILIMSAARLMTVALTKLENIQGIFQSASTSVDLWNGAFSKLVELVSSRAPTYHDFVTALQNTPHTQTAVRRTILECMAKYNQTLPTSVVGSKFDVGPVIIDVINNLACEADGPDQIDDMSNQLVSLVEIANFSSTIRWWHKPKPDCLSPFLGLIKVYATNELLRSKSAIYDSIRAVFFKTGIVRSTEMAVNAFLASFYEHHGAPVSTEVYLFAENCMLRTAKQPVKYFDQLEAAQKALSDTSSLSLLPFCIAEQWPFVIRGKEVDTVKEFADWVARLFVLLETAGESEAVLRVRLRKEILAQTGDNFGGIVAEAFVQEDDQHVKAPHTTNGVSEPQRPDSKEEKVPARTHIIDLATVFPSPSPAAFSLKGLTNWAKADLESELVPPITTSRLARLTHCLSSSVEEIRLQALESLQSAMQAVSTSSHVEKDQIYLLLGEICETSCQHALTSVSPVTQVPTDRLVFNGNNIDREKEPALPTFITQLATLLLAIIADPSDKMYSKANRFLMRGPTWTPVTRVLTYWIDQILLREPEYDEPFMWEFEVNRLLDLLVSGLVTTQDIELYRKGAAFERLGSLYVSTALAGKGGLSMKKKILHVLSRAMGIEGGANTLITRMGARSWLHMMRAREGTESEFGRILIALSAKLEDRCQESYIKKWETTRPVFTHGEKK